MFKRLLHLNLKQQESIFLFGPRGTGKTQWLKTHLPNALYFDLLDNDVYTELLAQPTRLTKRIPKDHTDWIIIDEVQRVPALLNEVHRLIEHQGMRFVLTGSSARALKRKGINLLAGRALTHHMHPLTTQELGQTFDLQRALQFGHLPAAVQQKQPNRYLRTYIQTYLKEEIQQESLTRSLPLFSRFLEVASFSQGEELNYTNIAREIGSTRHTIANFFDVLEDLLIAVRIPVFTKKAKRDTTSHPKFYYFDTGIYRSLRPQGPLDDDTMIEGPALETLFLQELRAINDYHFLEYGIYFWRTRTQHEVDFILYGPRGLIAFEIKRKNHLTNKDFKSLHVFKQDYPMAQCYMLYGGDRQYHEAGIEVTPFTQAIQELYHLIT